MRPLHWAILCAAVIAAFVVGILLGGWRTPPPPGPGTTQPATKAAAKPQIWTCAMHPQIRQPKPGQCPLCGMDLIPVDTGAEDDDEAASMRRFVTSPAARELMKIQTSPVERRYVTAVIRMVGKVAYDETRIGHITAWMPGRLERLHVDYTGVRVNKGEHLVDIYSPELLAAQRELIENRRAIKALGPEALPTIREGTQLDVESSREKLRLLGFTPEQIKAIEDSGEPTDRMTINAPMGGTVIHKNAFEGMYVKTGTRIYTIADLSQVWVKMDAYESDVPWVRYGQRVEFRTEAHPGEPFTGTIIFVDPVLDPTTRTVKVRVNVPNPDGKLKPEMFVRGVVRAEVASAGRVMDPDLAGKWMCSMHPEVVKDGPGACDLCEMPLVTTESQGYVPVEALESSKPLVIPVTAALLTGTRAVVYVEVPEAKRPTFEGREIVLGPRAGDYYIVRHGLQEGELVVTNGNFKIDSALQIQAKPSMMTPEGGGGGGGGGGGHHHGGGSAAKPGASEQGAGGTTLPRAVRRQLAAVHAAYLAVAKSMKTEDREQIRAGFVKVGEAVDGVKADLLSGHSRMLVTELSMLLKNDAVEGRDVRDLAEAQRVYALLQNHIRRLIGQFDVTPDAADALAGRRFATPDAFQAQVKGVWEAYQAVHGALAGDDLAKARDGAAAVEQALAAVDMKLLKGDAHAAWMTTQTTLRDAAKQAAESQDIAAARTAFERLSDRLAAAIRSYGIGAAGPVYQLHCPMAFDNRGATWLQRDKDTRNPYFGASMLTCGGVTETLQEHRPGTSGGHTDE